MTLTVKELIALLETYEQSDPDMPVVFDTGDALWNISATEDRRATWLEGSCFFLESDEGETEVLVLSS
jgi:hypothetical protein